MDVEDYARKAKNYYVYYKNNGYSEIYIYICKMLQITYDDSLIQYSLLVKS